MTVLSKPLGSAEFYSKEGLGHKVGVLESRYTYAAVIKTLIVGILGVGALAACAATPPHHAVSVASAIPPGWCSTVGGKPLRPGSSDCDALTRAYSGKQLRQTGMTDAAHALEMLDPSVTVH